jgi:hypothetical protein
VQRKPESRPSERRIAPASKPQGTTAADQLISFVDTSLSLAERRRLLIWLVEDIDLGMDLRREESVSHLRTVLDGYPEARLDVFLAELERRKNAGEPLVRPTLTANESIVAFRRRDGSGRGQPTGTVCPSCGHDLVRFTFRSPAWTWASLCGREMIVTFCDSEMTIRSSRTTKMN